MTPSGMRGLLNDAVSIYFLDTTLASAFVARWCAGYKAETVEGVFRVRDDEPAARNEASLHRSRERRMSVDWCLYALNLVRNALVTQTSDDDRNTV
jgi:hypothetical protein